MLYSTLTTRLRRYGLILCVLASLCAHAHSSELYFETPQEPEKTNALALSKSDLHHYIIKQLSADNLALDTRKFSKEKKQAFIGYCNRLLHEFKNNKLSTLEPKFISNERANIAQTAPQAFKSLSIDDIYVEHNNQQRRYATLQAPFEFYEIALKDKVYKFVYSWYSQIENPQKSLSNKGLYRIYDRQNNKLNEFVVDYSSNGPKPDHETYEGFNLLIRKDDSLFLVNNRVYFDKSQAADFFSIKYFDTKKNNFVTRCNYFGKNILRLFPS